MARRRTRWLLREPVLGTEWRLFCLPFSGTGASSFRHWPPRVGPAEVCAVQLPGRENRIREEPYQHIEAFAAEAAAELATYFDRPYAFFGHCTGALLAHALTVAVERLDARPPSRLFVSSARVPHWPPSERYRPPRPGRAFTYHPAMPDAELAEELSRVSGALGNGEPPPELLPLALSIMRNDVEMCFRYAPVGPQPVQCPVTAIAWRQDGDVAPADMLAWDGYGTVSHRTLEGGKLAYLSAPAELMGLIRDELASPVEARR